MKLKKKKKSVRMRGTRLHGWAFKKHKGSGSRGGVGMAGTGKRADHRKSWIIKYDWPYFGKKARKYVKEKGKKSINLFQIEGNLKNFVKKGIAKEEKGAFEINLKDFKILGEGEIKSKIIITALSASESAKVKIEKAGGKIILKESKIEKKE